MTWEAATVDHPDPRVAATAFLYEALNPVLLADGYSQDQADVVLDRMGRDLWRAVTKAKPHEQREVGKHFALRCITEYRSGGHLTH